VEKALYLGAIRFGGGVFPHGFQQNCLKLSYRIHILNSNSVAFGASIALPKYVEVISVMDIFGVISCSACRCPRSFEMRSR
jgi:hypothetical protein